MSPNASGGGGSATAVAQKPQAPKAPPADVLASNFSLDASDMAEIGDDASVDSTPAHNTPAPKLDPAPTGDTTTVTPTAPVATPVTPAATPEPPVAPPTKPTATPPVQQVALPGATPGATARDYTGFSDEEQTLLKQMSNPAFEFTAKLLREQRAAAKQRTDSYLAHPQAYTLTPEYARIRDEGAYQRAEGEYWAAQLEAIKAGKAWKPITGWDKTGRVMTGAEQPATDLAEEQVRLAMQNCFRGANETQQRLTAFQSEFTSQVTQVNRGIDAEMAKRFAWVEKPELQDQTIDIPEAGPTTVRQIREHFVGLFPAWMRADKGIEVASHMFVALQSYAAQLRAAQTGQQVAQIKATEAARGEPKTTLQPSKPAKTKYGVDSFDMEGMA